MNVMCQNEYVVHLDGCRFYNSEPSTFILRACIAPQAHYMRRYKIVCPLRDRGGTVTKVLSYKSEGRWFDPSWCH